MSLVLDNKEYHTFVKGLNTEANPLNFPEGYSLEEDNFVLTQQGFRKRRLGLDREEGGEWELAGVTGNEINLNDHAINQIMWENVSGDPDLTIIVIQIGPYLHFYDASVEPITLIKLNGGSSFFVDLDNAGDLIQGVSMNGDLVLTVGRQDILVLHYNSSTDSISSQIHGLLVRDTWGIDDGLSPTEVTSDDADDITAGYPPSTGEQIYNLYNQGWRRSGLENWLYNAEAQTATYPPSGDYFYLDAYLALETGPSGTTNANRYPTHSHIPSSGINTTTGGGRWDPSQVRVSPLTDTYAPRGSNIIDIFNRWESRAMTTAGFTLLNNYGAEDWGDGINGAISQLTDFVITNKPVTPVIPVDRSLSGVSCVENYAGRLFYAGFSSDMIGGDTRSPTLGNYVLFSQVVDANDKIGKCYQQGDPTISTEKDIVETDGGYISITGMGEVKKLITIGKSLAVIATNGVWEITGSEQGFSATNFQVKKVSNLGCNIPKSVVDANDTVFYWSETGIYTISMDPVTLSLSSQNVSDNTIKEYYNSIPKSKKVKSSGTYDPFSKTVTWTHGNNSSITNGREHQKALILDLRLGSFYTFTFSDPTADDDLYVVGSIALPKLYNMTANYTVNGSPVSKDLGSSATKYLILKDNESVEAFFTFGCLRNYEFKEWASLDTVPKDVPARLVTGYIALDDTQRQKQSVYLTTHFKCTEDFVDDSDDLIGGGGCLVSANWAFADSDNSGKITEPFQAYRLARGITVSDTNGSIDYGHSLISTKSKLRGRGRALSLVFESTPGKDLVLYGWGLVLSGSSDV